MDVLTGGSPRLRMAERPQRMRDAGVDEEESWNPWQYRLSYRVLVEKVYKGERRVKSKSKVKLISSADSGICGMTMMNEKTKYLITGKQMLRSILYTLSKCYNFLWMWNRWLVILYPISLTQWHHAPLLPLRNKSVHYAVLRLSLLHMENSIKMRSLIIINSTKKCICIKGSQVKVWTYQTVKLGQLLTTKPPGFEVFFAGTGGGRLCNKIIMTNLFHPICVDRNTSGLNIRMGCKIKYFGFSSIRIIKCEIF